MDQDDKIRQSMRHKLHTEVEFYIDADIITAESIDVSQTGIKFETNDSIKVCMRVNNSDGTFNEHMAELVWAQKEEFGGATYGLRFLSNYKESIETDPGKHITPEELPGEWEE